MINPGSEERRAARQAHDEIKRVLQVGEWNVLLLDVGFMKVLTARQTRPATPGCFEDSVVVTLLADRRGRQLVLSGASLEEAWGKIRRL